MNPLQILSGPIQWVITALYNGTKGFGPFAAVGAFGVAVIVTTLVIRTILFPLFAWQLRNSRRMQEQQRLIGPQLQELRKKYRGQPQKLTEEMQKVYREHGMNPLSGLSGCLPMLVQMPVIYSLYSGIRTAVDMLPKNADLHFLWASDVSKSATEIASGSTSASFPNSLITDFAHPVVIIIPLLAAVATFVQSRMMMQPIREGMTPQELSMQKLSKQMSMILPFMIFILAVGFPVGISLYWVTQSAYMVIQQYYMLGWGGMKVPGWMPGSSRTTALSYALPGPGAAGATMGNGAGANGSSKSNQSSSSTPPSLTGTPVARKTNKSAKARKRRR